MKYIIFDNKYPVLFPDYILHCNIFVYGMKPTSAGHYSQEKGTYDVSETLGLSPKSEDKDLIKNLLIK